MSKIKSMIVPHPLWEEVEVTKEFKKTYRKQTGLEAKRSFRANEKYWELLEDLLVKK